MNLDEVIQRVNQDVLRHCCESNGHEVSRWVRLP